MHLTAPEATSLTVDASFNSLKTLKMTVKQFALENNFEPRTVKSDTVMNQTVT